ncbi:MAG: toprim domain-containing protein, partial [Acidimicrobiales bacterium]
VCGLIGRNRGDDRFPKYKNPPRTAVYDKSVNLYQPLPAPSDPAGHVVVVEGTLDAMAIAVAAISSGRAGAFCPITQSGRELSARQLRYPINLHPTPIVIAFDADAAGRESTERLARRAAEDGRQVLVARLPEGDDPASFLAGRGPSGLDAWTDQSCRRLTPRRMRGLKTRGTEVPHALPMDIPEGTLVRMI